MTRSAHPPPHLFKPGQSGNPAGRAKGVKSKKVNVILRLEAAGFDLIGALIHTAQGKDLPRDEEGNVECSAWCRDELSRMDWARGKLLDRIVPVLKSVEHSAKEGQSYGLTVVFGSNCDKKEEESTIIDVTAEK